MNNIADFEKTNPTLPLRLASGLRARTSRLLNHQLKTGLLCLGLTALGTLSALASHFRYGTLSSQWIGPDGQMKFSLSAGYRRDFGSFLPASPKNTPPLTPNLGDVFSDPDFNVGTGGNGFVFGDNAVSSQIWFRVTAVNITDDWIVGEALDPSVYSAINNLGTALNSPTNAAFRASLPAGISHTYLAAGPFTAFAGGCCRLALNNGAGDLNDPYRVETLVSPFSQNSSPVSSLPPIITLTSNSAATFFVPAADPNGDTLFWRLATTAESGNVDGNPTGLSIDSTTGQVTWNTTSVTLGLWTVQFMIEDLTGPGGTVKSKTPVDVILNVVNVSDAPPVAKINGSQTPTPITVQMGQSVSFTLQGTDPDPGATVTLYSAGLPAGATMTPSLPFTSAQPVQSVFNWTPSASQFGSQVLSFFAADNLGLQSLVSITILVNRPPMANCKPATIKADPNCQAAVVPALINNNSSDPDGNPITLAVSDASNPTPAASLTLSGAGDHTVTLTVRDNHGGVSTCTTKVTVVDATPPVITILGDNPATVECHTAYTDAGATAQDNCAGDLTGQIVFTSNVDANTPGTYFVIYAVSDPSKNPATATRTVIVQDTTPPQLSVNGPILFLVECHTPYVDAGATAFDTCAGDLTSQILPDGKVDVNTPGTYSISYTVTDPSGNKTGPVIRQVVVQDMTPPVVTLNGSPALTVECHTPYGELGATAFDSCAGDLTSQIVPVSTVDVNTPGNYTVTYNVIDPAGNPARAIRNVTVTDTTPPVITASGTPADGVLRCNPTAAQIEAALGTATVSDTCGTPGMTNTTANVVNTSACGRSQTRTWNAIDPSGNQAAASRTVTWTVDTTPPVISCPPDVVVTCGSSTDPSATGTATATDDCGTVTVSYSDSGTLNCQPPFGTITRTWTAVDGCGNASTCVQTLSSCLPVTSSITSSFNGTSISTSNSIWFSANFSAKGIPASGATIFVKNSTIAITSAKGNFSYSVPDGRIVFSPSASCATTLFDGVQWVTTVPVSGSDEILLSALGIKSPADLKAASVTWSGAFSADTPGISLSWKWGAAVYTTDMTQAQYNNLGVKPTHTAACLYNNSDHAGTPEKVKQSVIGGARGGGGSNYTGSWSGTTSVNLCP